MVQPFERMYSNTSTLIGLLLMMCAILCGHIYKEPTKKFEQNGVKQISGEQMSLKYQNNNGLNRKCAGRFKIKLRQKDKT